MSEAPLPTSPAPRGLSRRRRVLAVLLSCVPTPGAGHWALGLWGRGLFFLAAFLMGFALVPFMGLSALVAVLVLYVAAAVDVGRVAPPARGVPSRGVALLCVMGFALWPFTGGSSS